MKMTVLDMVQSLLASMESDQVDSINDTQESYDLALLLRDLYYDIANDLSLPEHEILIELEASGSSTKPTLMTVPTTVTSIDWIKYDCRLDGETTSTYKTIEYLPFSQFIDMQAGIKDDDAAGIMNITSGGNTFDIPYMTDKGPSFYTIVSDTTIIFDSYDSDVDTTLQKSKTMCMGRHHPVFTLDDEFTPDLNPQQFSYYLNRAKVRAFSERKQITHGEAQNEARRQKIIGQKKKQTVSEGTAYDQLTKFGRKSKR